MHVLMKGTGRLSAGRAVKLLKRLGAGGEIALLGSFRGASPAAPLLDPDQARAWLSQLDGEALIIHDDASISTDDIEKLRRAHVRSGRPSAPDPKPREKGFSQIPAVLGAPSQLSELLDPESQIFVPIDRVAGLDLAHAMDCASTPERPLLVASMIVRNEADQIGGCLESLAGLIDRVEVVDTGSTDDTVRIAEAHGASVTSFEWSDDFSAARNVALDRCRDARYVLHVDADERLVATDNAAVRRELESSQVRAARVPMRNVVDGKVTTEFEAVRIFSTDNTVWVGRVHEFPADLDGTPLSSGRLDGIRLDHLGYDPQIVAAKDKLNRNVALAEAAYAAEPGFKTRLDLARSLAWRSDNERAFALFREAADDLTGASPVAAAFAIAHVALEHQINGDFERAHELAEQALEFCSGEYAAHLARARAWRATGNDEAIVAAHIERQTSELATPLYDSAAAHAGTDNLTVGALARLGRHVEALELAVATLDRDPARFDEWSSLAMMPAALRTTGLPLLASMDPGGTFAAALVGEVPMGELANLVLAHVQACEPAPETVITGIMAAVLAGYEETAAAITRAAVGALDPTQRAATAERCRLRGATEVASMLDPIGLAR